MREARRRLKAGCGQNCPPHRQVWQFGHTANSIRYYLDDVLVVAAVQVSLRALESHMDFELGKLMLDWAGHIRLCGWFISAVA